MASFPADALPAGLQSIDIPPRPAPLSSMSSSNSEFHYPPLAGPSTTDSPAAAFQHHLPPHLQSVQESLDDAFLMTMVQPREDSFEAASSEVASTSIAAAAQPPPLPPAVQSSSKKRTRSGCLVCRRRKVKCDERPGVCLNCERLRVDCQWPNEHNGGLTQARKHLRKACNQVLLSPNLSEPDTLN